MARPDLSSIDRELDGFAVDATKLDAARARARQIADEVGGADGFFRALGEAPPPPRAKPAPRPATAPVANAPPKPPTMPPPPPARAKPATMPPPPPAAARPPTMPPPPPAAAKPPTMPPPAVRPPTMPPPPVIAETVVPEGFEARPTSFEAVQADEAARGNVEGEPLAADEALSSAEMPAVLSVAPDAAPEPPLPATTARDSEPEGRPSIEVMVESPIDDDVVMSPMPQRREPAAPLAGTLELESDGNLDLAGAAPLDSLFATIPKEVLAAAPKPATQPPPAATKPDYDAELAALFAEESEPPPSPPAEEPLSPPITFDADAHMPAEAAEASESYEEFGSEPTSISRPDMMLPTAPGETAEGDFELDVEEVEVLDDDELVETASSETELPAQASAKSRPPEPPRSRPPPPSPPTRPPEPPGKGLLGRILNRKP